MAKAERADVASKVFASGPAAGTAACAGRGAGGKVTLRFRGRTSLPRLRKTTTRMAMMDTPTIRARAAHQSWLRPLCAHDDEDDEGSAASDATEATHSLHSASGSGTDRATHVPAHHWCDAARSTKEGANPGPAPLAHFARSGTMSQPPTSFKGQDRTSSPQGRAPAGTKPCRRKETAHCHPGVGEHLGGEDQKDKIECEPLLLRPIRHRRRNSGIRRGISLHWRVQSTTPVLFVTSSCMKISNAKLKAMI